MELDYVLHSVFSLSESKIKDSTNQLQALLEEDSIKYKELKKIAKANDAVMLIEVEQDDGFIESIIVNNIGKIKERGRFSIKLTGEIRSKLNPENCDEYFTKDELEVINNYVDAYGISCADFLNQYLDQYLYNIYEQKRDRWGQNIEQYYQK
ncbi:hypothetical protein OAO42_00905 [Candidatus Izimaplasma bacterium]|nr:hypothetical protein [Candidatus Izimaplasma bacterium]